MHSIFSVKSVFLGSTAATCENMLLSSVDGFPQVRAQELCNILQELSSNVFKRHRYSKKLCRAISQVWLTRDGVLGQSGGLLLCTHVMMRVLDVH